MTEQFAPADPVDPIHLPGSSWRNIKKEDFFKGERLFHSPEELWEAACGYFAWIEDNPIITQKLFSSQGVVTRAEVPVARVFTIQGLCLYLGISRDTFHKWSVGTDTTLLQPACRAIRDVIYAQKFEGAASDIFNPTIISRDLGLRDVKEVSGPNGGPMQVITSDMDAQEAAAAYAATLQNVED